MAARTLVAAVSSITFVLVTGIEGLLGLGPAIFLVASASAAIPAGRLMDRIGRRPVIGGGYLLAAVGCAEIQIPARARAALVRDHTVASGGGGVRRRAGEHRGDKRGHGEAE